MPKIEKTVSIAAPPSAVWSIGGDVGGIHRWVGSVEACSMVDDNLRRVTLDRGRGEMTERVLSRSDSEMTYEYELVEKDGPLRSYRSRFTVKPRGTGSVAVWAADFEFNEGVAGPEVTEGLVANYEASLEQLRLLAEKDSVDGGIR